MGNTSNKDSVDNKRSINSASTRTNTATNTSTSTIRHRVRIWEQSISSFSFNLSARSFASLNSSQSTYSVTRPWSRVSRRRWKESTLTIPFESSKTAWPVSHIESYFLPDFPLNPTFYENNFDVVEFVSYGAFGKVYKVKDKATNQVYALKVLSKSQIIKENSIQQVKDEVQIQRVCGHHPFIVDCPFHWQTRKRLYIVTDFVEGGELHKLLETYGILPFVLVQIFVAEIALALDFLHNAGIIYRDLKPENILLDSLGHVQLVDFGLSKWLAYGSRTRTLCGTLRYMAPEVISLEPYGHAVDWWSLGVIACYMLTEKFPTASVPEKNSKKPGTLPDGHNLDLKSRDLLMRLLEPDPSRRLRSLRVLQTLAFFMGFDFEEIKMKKSNIRALLHEHFPGGPPNRPLMELHEEFQDFNLDCNQTEK